MTFTVSDSLNTLQCWMQSYKSLPCGACVCVCVCVCVECVCGVGVWYVCGVCMRWGGLAVVTLKDLRCQASLAIMLTV